MPAIPLSSRVCGYTLGVPCGKFSVLPKGPQLFGTRLVTDPPEDLPKAGRGECFPGQVAETSRLVGRVIISVGMAVSCGTWDLKTPVLSTIASR
eukprot:356843-Chlamydomonas_euryale.AAC.3